MDRDRKTTPQKRVGKPSAPATTAKPLQRRKPHGKTTAECDPTLAPLYYTAFRRSMDILAVIGAGDGRIIDISDQVQTMLGYHPSGLIGRHFSDLFPREHLSRSELLERLRTYDAVLVNQKFLRADGSIVLLDVTAALIQGEAGEVILLSIRGTAERQQAEARQNRLLIELQKALEKVKLLSGFLPICSYCKRIRDDEGYWTQVEEFIRTHSEADFSHSICPTCLELNYPYLAKKKSGQ